MLKVLHLVLSYPPFKSMHMEAPLGAMLLLKKKNYSYLNYEGRLTSKGMSAPQNNRLGICRLLIPIVLNKPLKNSPSEQNQIHVGSNRKGPR